MGELIANLRSLLDSPWAWLAWMVYLGVLGSWIVRQKREPVATLAWLLALAWLPLVGLVIYWALGPQRLRRRGLRRLRSRLQIAGQLNALGESVATEGDLEALALRVSGFAATSASRAELLSGGSATFDALLAAIADAKHSIHLEYYIFEPDAIGTRIRDALASRARAGIKVRLLLDGVGSSRCSPRFLAPLRQAGGEVAWFHPLAFAQILWRRTVNLRMHRKLVVVDGRLGFTGGVNIADNQHERLSATAFHDLHLRLEGEVVRSLQLAFVEDWHYCTGDALGDSRLWPALPTGGIRTQLLPSGPDNPWAPIQRVYVEAIHQARQRVWLMTPYFVPDAPALQALTSAAQRGLDVRVLLPRHNDSALVGAAACSFYREMLDAGVAIWEFQPRMLHGKALLVDADLACIGSANFDARSFRLNFELSLKIRDHAVASALADRIQADLVQSRLVPVSWRPGLRADLAQSLARLLTPVL